MKNIKSLSSIFIILIITIVIYSCGDGDSDGNSVFPPGTKENYGIPLKVGNWWKYNITQIIEETTDTGYAVRTIVDTVIINNKIYYKMETKGEIGDGVLGTGDTGYIQYARYSDTVLEFYDSDDLGLPRPWAIKRSIPKYAETFQGALPEINELTYIKYPLNTGSTWINTNLPYGFRSIAACTITVNSFSKLTVSAGEFNSVVIAGMLDAGNGNFTSWFSIVGLIKKVFVGEDIPLYDADRNHVGTTSFNSIIELTEYYIK